MKCRVTGEQVDHCAGDCARCDQIYGTTERIINHRARDERGESCHMKAKKCSAHYQDG